MRFNQFSYYPVTNQQALQELSELDSSLIFQLHIKNSLKPLLELVSSITKIPTIHFPL